MSMVSRRIATALALALLASGGLRASAAESGSPACRLTPNATADVAAVRDGRTLQLADGRLVRLAGIADLELSGAPDAAGVADSHAIASLAALTRGHSLSLQVLGTDRYGRQLALAAPVNARTGAAIIPLQRALIAQGEAVVAADTDLPAGCVADWLSAERAARKAHLGLWADPQYLIRQAGTPTSVSQVRGRFTLVEGKVISVRTSRATTYVNFGRRWSRDFTVTIAKRNLRKFTAAGHAPQSFDQHRVIARGWIDERGGPWIEARRPEQIEFAE